MPWFVYLLGCSNTSCYVGHTEDVVARVQRHHNGTAGTWTAAATVAMSGIVTFSATAKRMAHLPGSGRKPQMLLIPAAATIYRT
ncbi:MAG: GIY-YIG nuclease family protein [Phycisphaerae bacterium]|jgi:predicted GIY-YIG superfamily endonuclease|nr:GIY-YIG nuclease family protein [Phycisphaerae bacterium]